MSYLEHISRCNSKNLKDFLPFLLEGQQIGWVRSDNAKHLLRFPHAFSISDQFVQLSDGLKTPTARTETMAEILKKLSAEDLMPAPRGEDYAVKVQWSDPELFRIDRAAVAWFGIKAYGVHVNGYIRRADGLHLWIGRRAKDKTVAPGKFDNLVAGGQPAGLSLKENLIKEAEEEAGISRALAEQALPVAAITYCFSNEHGLKPDTLYCYDLEVPEDFIPVCQDGEMSGFELWPVRKALDVIRDSHDFKFNVNLVLLDFAIRHGVLTPDDEPAYDALVLGLHSPHPGFD